MFSNFDFSGPNRKGLFSVTNNLLTQNIVVILTEYFLWGNQKVDLLVLIFEYRIITFFYLIITLRKGEKAS